MNRHAGASFTLSILIVSFFGIALYQPDPQDPPPAAEASPAKIQTASAVPDARPSAPAPTQGTPLVEVEAEPIPAAPVREVISTHFTRPQPRPSRSPSVASPVVASKPPQSRPSRKPAASPPQTATTSSKPSDSLRTTSRRSLASRRSPQSAFTETVEGESLKDIALRVYGDPTSIRTLWLANRDIIPDQNSPLRGGTLLRTPDD